MIQFYHPTKDVRGTASSFWYSDRNDAAFATILKQSGWDEQNQNGVFKASVDDPTKKATIKLDWVELGGILDCIERNRPFTSFHDFDDKPKAISFQPRFDKTEPTKQIGFAFSITITDKQDSTKKESFYIAFRLPEARLIREYIIYLLHTHFKRVNKPASTFSNYGGQKASEQPAPTEAPVAEDPLTGKL